MQQREEANAFPRYINSSSKLLWVCGKGHQWEATPARIKSGSWCVKCKREHAFDHRKLTITEMQELAKKRGGVCLSEEYINSKTPLKWMCGQQHTWEASPISIKRGSWCEKCFRKRLAGLYRSTIEEIQELAAKRGGVCLSKEYVNSRTHLKWKCKYGHTWEASADSIKSGHWCSVCSNNKKLTIEDMRSLAHGMGGKCLSETYRGINAKLLWECAEVHTWEAAPNHIKEGHWCPDCRGGKKLSLEDMHRAAAERGGKCLSSEYQGAFTKLAWECANGHR